MTPVDDPVVPTTPGESGYMVSQVVPVRRSSPVKVSDSPPLTGRTWEHGLHDEEEVRLPDDPPDVPSPDEEPSTKDRGLLRCEGEQDSEPDPDLQVLHRLTRDRHSRGSCQRVGDPFAGRPSARDQVLGPSRLVPVSFCDLSLQPVTLFLDDREGKRRSLRDPESMRRVKYYEVSQDRGRLPSRHCHSRCRRVLRGL